MAPISPTTAAVAMLALLLSPASAFVAPTAGLAGLRNQPASSSSSRFASTTATARSSLRQPRTPLASVRLSMVSEAAEEKASKLRETAARFREEAAELEAAREVERRAGADRSFNTFDSNKDGGVDIAELKAGLEGPLRKSYVKQLTARMGRKPDRDEIEARIAQLPGGSLFPDNLAQKLIDTYDENGDGILQKSEFVPSDELRTKVESMFREQRDEERLARMEERQRQMEEKIKSQEGAPSGRGAGGAEGMNDGPPTIADKALSALPYVLPLADSLAFAGHIFAAFPEQLAWAQPLVGVLLALRSLPFATLVAFFGLSILSSSPQINKLVRFNMQQAINLDIALILPGILGALTSASLGQDAYKLVPIAQAGSDVVFVALLVAVAYSVGASANGAFPNKLPLLGKMNRENPDREEQD